jgi:hypothetical protein
MPSRCSNDLARLQGMYESGFVVEFTNRLQLNPRCFFEDCFRYGLSSTPFIFYDM